MTTLPTERSRRVAAYLFVDEPIDWVIVWIDRAGHIVAEQRIDPPEKKGER